MAVLNLQKFQQVPITSGLLALNVIIWLGQISPVGYLFTNQMFFAPLFAAFEPWRMLTAGFVHDWTGPFHILLNSYAIWIFGRILEPLLGPVRFLVMYLTAIVGGSVAVMWLSDPQVPVVGASVALFGLMCLLYCGALHGGQFHPNLYIDCHQLRPWLFCFWNLLGGPLGWLSHRASHCRNLFANQTKR